MLFLFGFAKNAVMPLHSWLPAAMVAPTPVSALLHAVAVVKTGVFATLRVFLFVFGTDAMRQLGADNFALGVASVTILVGSLLALGQDNLKARLAFSTISQLSYIVLGAALLTPSGILGGIAHITNHAVSKITLFLCAGSIYVSTHKTEISQMSGLARQMPWTMAAFAVASLSLVGIPPASGFVSKWYLALGSVERGSTWLLGVLLASSLLNAAYLGPIVYKAYFEEAPDSATRSDRRGALDGHPSGTHRPGQPAPGRVPESCPEPRGKGVAVTFLEKQLEDPVRLKRMKRWFYAGLAALALSEVAVPRLFETDHAHFWFEDIPGLGLHLRLDLLCGDHRRVKAPGEAVAHASGKLL